MTFNLQLLKLRVQQLLISNQNKPDLFCDTSQNLFVCFRKYKNIQIQVCNNEICIYFIIATHYSD